MGLQEGYGPGGKGFGEWGRKMQTDLSDGVRRLARAGIIDPQRACIVGDGIRQFSTLSDEVFAVVIDSGDHGNAGVEYVGRTLGERIQSFTFVPLQDPGRFQRVDTLGVIVRHGGLLGYLGFFRVDDAVNATDRLLNGSHDSIRFELFKGFVGQQFGGRPP